ncbi:hypothetical protein [Pontibacter saemangeumensis]|uniref:hypothetical protein n=1 Tax=Pontibacter saemangeumensis TaxID=1084525 RepID=UPI0031EEE83C
MKVATALSFSFQVSKPEVSSISLSSGSAYFFASRRNQLEFAQGLDSHGIAIITMDALIRAVPFDIHHQPSLTTYYSYPQSLDAGLTV